MLPSLPLEASGGARGTQRGGGDDFAAAEGAQHTSPGMKVGMEARSLRVRVPSPPSVVSRASCSLYLCDEVPAVVSQPRQDHM